MGPKKRIKPGKDVFRFTLLKDASLDKNMDCWKETNLGVCCPVWAGDQRVYIRVVAKNESGLEYGVNNCLHVIEGEPDNLEIESDFLANFGIELNIHTLKPQTQNASNSNRFQYQYSVINRKLYPNLRWQVTTKNADYLNNLYKVIFSTYV